MVVYFITRNGKILTNKSIQHILEEMVKDGKIIENNCIFRCGPSLNQPNELKKEFNEVIDDKLLVYYESIGQWKVLTNEEIEVFMISAQYERNQKLSSGDILHTIFNNDTSNDL